MNSAIPAISAIILAGGQSRRFDYQDKGLQTWQGKALVAHVIDALKPQCKEILISCNQHIDHYQEFGLNCIKDQQTDFQGPLAGIQQGLKTALYDYCLICPCDSPVLPENLSVQLFQTLINNEADVAYVFDGERKQYLIALIHRSLISSLNDYLQGGDRSVKGWYATLNSIGVDFSAQHEYFYNINSAAKLDDLNQQ